MAGFSPVEFAELNGLLASAVERGLDPAPTLDLLAAGVRRTGLRDALQGAARGLREGASLPDAFSRYPRAFPPEFCALVRAGVDGHRLAPTLRQVQTDAALRGVLRSRMCRLLLYLGTGLAIAQGAIFLGMRLQATTGELIVRSLEIRDFEDFRIVGWVMTAFLLGGTLLGAAAVQGLRRWSALGWMGYRIPVWGRVMRSRDLALFCTTIALRLRSGAGTPEALGGARDVLRNGAARRRVDRLIARAKEGDRLSTALFYEPFFPRTLAWATAMGEERGDVPEVFDGFARLYTGQMERSFELVYQILTPIGILLVGNLALWAATLVLAPIFWIIRAMQFL